MLGVIGDLLGRETRILGVGSGNVEAVGIILLGKVPVVRKSSPYAIDVKEILGLAASALERSVDTESLILHTKTESIVESREGIAVIHGDHVVLVDDIVIVDILVLDVADLDLSEFLQRAVVDVSLILEESDGNKSAGSVGRLSDPGKVRECRGLDPLENLALDE